MHCAQAQRLEFVAPVDGDALRAILTSANRPAHSTLTVLWLDDLEPFLNDGVTLATLREWHGGVRGRIVAATYGGKGSERIAGLTTDGLTTIAAEVLQNAREIPMTPTTTRELGALRARISAEQFASLERHGLAAYLVAAPQLERSEDELAVYDDVVARLGAATEPALRELVAGALFNKGVALGALERSEDELAVYDDVVARLGAATEPALRELVARALFNKGVRLGALERSEDELAVYDDVVARLGAATEPALREQVARALFNKGVRLGALERSEDELAVYDDVVARFGAATEPILRQAVAMARTALEQPSSD